MRFEAKAFFALAVLAGTCATVRNAGNTPMFLLAACVTYLAAALAISLHHLGRLIGDRSCR